MSGPDWMAPAGILQRLPELTFYRGRVGLYAILKALGIGAGDEVATQAFTCLAVPEGILATGAKASYVDIEDRGVNMDPGDLARKITARTKAIVVQHTFGIPARMREIQKLAAERGLPLIEDCCHTFASAYMGQAVGTFGIGAFFSFEWGKPIVAGVGGSVVARDAGLSAKIRQFHRALEEPDALSVLKIQLQYLGYGIAYSPRRYWLVKSAFHRLSAAGAAVGNYNVTGVGVVAPDFRRKMAAPLVRRLKAKIHHAGPAVLRAREIAADYGRLLPAVCDRPAVPEGANPVYARYPLFVDNKQDLLAMAREVNVELAEWYATPIHPLLPADWPGVGLEAGSCPNAERAAGRIVSLPVNTRVRPGDVEAAAELLLRSAR